MLVTMLKCCAVVAGSHSAKLFHRTLLQVRPFHRIKFPTKLETNLKMKDGVPSEYELIYKAPMIPYIILAQSTATVTISLLSLLGAYRLYKYPVALDTVARMNTVLQDDITLSISLAAFVTFNVAIYTVTLRYPFRIYRHQQTGSYLCIVNGFLPTFTKSLAYRAGDITRAVLPSYIAFFLPWKQALFKVGRKTIFIMENYFRTPADLSIMLAEL